MDVRNPFLEFATQLRHKKRGLFRVDIRTLPRNGYFVRIFEDLGTDGE